MCSYLADCGFDLSVRIIEIARYLEREGKAFARMERMMTCGSDAGMLIRQAEKLPPGKARKEGYARALDNVAECTYLLDLLSATEDLSDRQLRPIRAQCGALEEELQSAVEKAKGKV